MNTLVTLNSRSPDVNSWECLQLVLSPECPVNTRSGLGLEILQVHSNWWSCWRSVSSRCRIFWRRGVCGKENSNEEEKERGAQLLLNAMCCSQNNSHSVMKDDIWRTLFNIVVYFFSEYESLTHIHVCYMLSPVCRLSVCNVHAPYSGDWNFPQCFYAVWYLGHLWPFSKNFTEIVPGEPLHQGVKPKRGSQI